MGRGESGTVGDAKEEREWRKESRGWEGERAKQGERLLDSECRLQRIRRQGYFSLRSRCLSILLWIHAILYFTFKL